MVLLGGKVGGNIDMAGDGHIGGEKMICEKGCIVQRKYKKSKKFTVIGITTLIAEAIFCIVIIVGKKEPFYIRYGIFFQE